MMTDYDVAFVDMITGEVIAYTGYTREEALKNLCDDFGTDYILANFVDWDEA